MNELGERLHLDSGTLSPLLKRMEAADLLVRLIDPTDTRRRILSLTQRGRDLEVEAGPLQRCVAASVDLTRFELAELHQLTGRVVESLNNRRVPMDGRAFSGVRRNPKAQN